MPRYRQPQSLTEAIYRKDAVAIDGFIERREGLNDGHERYRKDRGQPTLPLVEAVRQGDVELVRRLIQAGANPDGVDGFETPTSMAITRDRVEILDVLHRAGATLAGRKRRDAFFDEDERDCMALACQCGSARALQWLIEHGGDPRQATRQGYTLVHAVVENTISAEDKKKLQLLRDNGADLLSAAHKKGSRRSAKNLVHPVSYAVVFGDREVVEWFMEAGADPNTICEHSIYAGRAGIGDALPLVGCAVLGVGNEKGPVVRELVERGARLDVLVDFNPNTMGPVCSMTSRKERSDNDLRVIGGTYLMLAAAWADEDCVRALLDAGMDPNAQDENGMSAVAVFFEKATRDMHDRSLGMLRSLLQAGADPSLADKNGNTPMHVLSEFCNNWASGPETDVRQWARDAAMMLLERGCDPGVRNKQGLTALDLAHYEHHAIVDLLRAHEVMEKMEAGTATPARSTRGGARL